MSVLQNNNRREKETFLGMCKVVQNIKTGNSPSASSHLPGSVGLSRLDILKLCRLALATISVTKQDFL